MHALREVTLRVEHGQVFGLLGPNGAGKSTLIKLALGLLQPSAGTLHVLGAAPERVETRRRIGYLPENTHLHPYLTAEETLRFYGRLFGLSAAVLRERTEQLLAMAGLLHARHRPISSFSKGMRRRVALAQALINRPEFLILDEPTSGLDPIGRASIRDLIRALGARGVTILVSSHLLAEVEDVCDHLAILFHGRVLASGAAATMLGSDVGLHVSLAGLDADGRAALEERLRDAIGPDASIAHARRGLEAYFLDTIAHARHADAPTGVTDHTVIAPFLLE